ncbi:hypothetical protein GCM10022267_55110 [Lentzea roselyniae]|uniref:Uncharacterized protein n=1 Tax=Lentzea roselyniae TaxID=531940 RepID=A0ABP7BJL6_9PSEU
MVLLDSDGRTPRWSPARLGTWMKTRTALNGVEAPPMRAVAPLDGGITWAEQASGGGQSRPSARIRAALRGIMSAWTYRRAGFGPATMLLAHVLDG